MEFSLPFFFGSMQFYWADTNNDNLKYNIKNSIKNITSEVSKNLTKLEINEVQNWFKKILEIDLFIKNNSSKSDLYNIIFNDLISAKDHFILHSYGMVEWQCLQASEKLLKQYIISYKNKTPGRIHILKDLIELAEINNPIILDLIPKIETSPSSRYETTTTREKSFKKYEDTINFLHEMIQFFV